jgi:hypothetical protein
LASGSSGIDVRLLSQVAPAVPPYLGGCAALRHFLQIKNPKSTIINRHSIPLQPSLRTID